MPRSRTQKRTITTLSTMLALCGAIAATAAASELPSQVSTNWAGYAAITGRSTHAFAKRFRSVSGTWTQPAATCTPGQPTFSAFWVGLGGYRQSARSLEQVGTEADCSAAGAVSYYAWYEYVPAGPITIRAIPINAGDVVTARVRVKGVRVTVRLTDITTGARFVHAQTMRSPRPDVGAAEWIAEAPSNCDHNSCTPLTLTNFGNVDFSNATATSVGVHGVHTGTIDDPHWIYGAIDLQASSSGLHFEPEMHSSATVGALALTGNSFSVTYTGGSASGATGTTGTSGSSGATGSTSAASGT